MHLRFYSISFPPFQRSNSWGAMTNGELTGEMYWMPNGISFFLNLVIYLLLFFALNIFLVSILFFNAPLVLFPIFPTISKELFLRCYDQWRTHKRNVSNVKQNILLKILTFYLLAFSVLLNVFLVFIHFLNFLYFLPHLSHQIQRDILEVLWPNENSLE